MPESVSSTSNTGGFGIDGILSTLVGASLADKEKLFFAILGDLAFFYDMNVAGNRHVGNNIRILFINNGKGTEFRNYNHLGALFGEEADNYIAAAGHFGNKSHDLVRHYAEDLGFEYLTADNKEEYLNNIDRTHPGLWHIYKICVVGLHMILLTVGTTTLFDPFACPSLSPN